jgi:cytochrome c553
VHLTPVPSVALTIWRNDLRHWIVLINIIVMVSIAGYLLWSVYSRRSKAAEKVPANVTPFLGDDELEGRRLERVLGWALMFVTLFAVAMLVYLVREPHRQDESIRYFDEGSVERGATLFANPEGEAYDAVLSLQCANCHGSEGAGGSTTQVIDPDGPNGPLPPESFTWRAPALNTVLLRFSPEEVAQIITYGRPGTPMQAFGVAGGGAENEQTIEDLIAFLDSIQLSPEDAQAEAADALEGAQGQAAAQVDAATTALEGATATRDQARAAVTGALGLPASTSDEDLEADCRELERELDAAGTADEQQIEQGRACREFLDDLGAYRDAVEALAWAEAWQESRRGVTDGQLLFELFCARCHTQGWSIFDPAEPNSTRVLGLAGGGGGQGGGIGFNLRDGATERRFGSGDQGFTSQSQFVANGSEPNVQYGNGGIGSGRMPGFGSMLTDDMIEAIVRYERDGLDETTYLPPVTTTTTGG